MDVVELYQRIAPELMKVVAERYSLLRHISSTSPIGRRMLAQVSGLSERVVRSHVETMKDNGLIAFSTQGMFLTASGEEALPILTVALQEWNKTAEREKALCQLLDLEKVLIVASKGGQEATLKDLGFYGAKSLLACREEGQVVAISGGSTMAALAAELPRTHCPGVFIPARGGIGEHIEFQANSIASVLADKMDGQYTLVHLPDGLSSESLEILKKMEPQIRELAVLAAKTDVLVFGIGEALHMAEQRHMTQDQRTFLREQRAAGEALGNYCDRQGKVVYATNNVGISLEDVGRIKHVIAVAGGAKKAPAIISVMRAVKKGTLIVDEAAAEAMLGLLQ